MLPPYEPVPALLHAWHLCNSQAVKISVLLKRQVSNCWPGSHFYNASHCVTHLHPGCRNSMNGWMRSSARATFLAFWSTRRVSLKTLAIGSLGGLGTRSQDAVLQSNILRALSHSQGCLCLVGLSRQVHAIQSYAIYPVTVHTHTHACMHACMHPFTYTFHVLAHHHNHTPLSHMLPLLQATGAYNPPPCP